MLRAEGVCRSFGSRSVLKSAALWARAGRVTALFGRNGSGKTTLLRVAAGLTRAHQGVVHFRGRVHVRPSLHRLAAAGLFFLPERDLLLRNVRVGRQLEIVARRCGAPDRVAKLAEEMHLAECLDRYPHELSGGERRRAELTIVLLREPLCLLADEPFMGIAPRDAELVARVLRDLATRGCAVVATGHEVPTLLDLADDVLWIVAGTTHSLGAPAGARRHWQFRREYLGA